MPNWLRLGDALARRAFELRSSLSKSFRAARVAPSRLERVTRLELAIRFAPL
jgi:hypothetical protein